MAGAQEGASVRVDVLGPMRLAVDGGPVDVRGPKRRAVLALLALAEGRTVTVDQVVDALWPDDPPESARATVHTHVSRLRGRPRARRAPSHHRRGRVPAATRRRRARPASGAEPARPGPRPRHRRSRRGRRAAARGAGGLARGRPSPTSPRCHRCARSPRPSHELWRDVTDRLAAALIAAGAAGEALGPAADAVADDPLREPAVLLLVRAQAATGQAPRALRTAREFRARLAEETGLDPSPALAALESDVAGGAAGPVAVPVPAAPVASGPPVPSVASMSRTCTDGTGSSPRPAVCSPPNALVERGRHRRGREDAHRARARPSQPRRGDPDARGGHRRFGDPGRAGRGAAPRLDHR